MNEIIEASDSGELPIAANQLAALANQRHGQAVMAGGLRKFFAAAEIKILKEIQDLKLFKYIPVEIEHGIFAPAKNFSEYVEKAIETSPSVVYEEIKTYEEFGDDAHDALNRLGVLRDEKRLLRKLPDEIKAQAQEAAEKGDKAALLEIIELQAEERRKEREQSAKDKAELERQIADKEADLKASRALSDRTAQQLREHQEAELRRKLGTPNQADRDRVVATLNTSADALKSRVLASFRKECLDVLDAHDGESAEFGRIIVAQALGLIMGAARMVGADLGVVPAADARIAYEQGAYAPGEKAWKLAQAELAAGAEG